MKLGFDRDKVTNSRILDLTIVPVTTVHVRNMRTEVPCQDWRDSIEILHERVVSDKTFGTEIGDEPMGTIAPCLPRQTMLTMLTADTTPFRLLPLLQVSQPNRQTTYQPEMGIPEGCKSSLAIRCQNKYGSGGVQSRTT